MKRRLLFLLGILILVSPFVVRAKENKLYFTGSGNRLYYNSALYDEAIFMKHTDMVPGSSYEDELVIANNARVDYKLYLRVKLREQSEAQLELLRNIEMTIFLDGKIIYEGKADGIDYTSSGVNLQNAIYIGNYAPEIVSRLVVKTRLSTEYSNTENREISYIDWEFVANYEDEVIPINPDTGDKIGMYLKYAVYALLIVMVLFILMKFYYKNV